MFVYKAVRGNIIIFVTLNVQVVLENQVHGYWYLTKSKQGISYVENGYISKKNMYQRPKTSIR